MPDLKLIAYTSWVLVFCTLDQSGYGVQTHQVKGLSPAIPQLGRAEGAAGLLKIVVTTPVDLLL